MSLFQLLEVRLHSETGQLRYADLTSNDLKRLPGDSLTILPNPMRVDCCRSSACCSSNVREHCQGDIEMIVGVRAPGHPVLTTELGCTNRTGHRPEVWISKQNVNGIQLCSVIELPPVSCNHICGRCNTGGMAKLGH